MRSVCCLVKKEYLLNLDVEMVEVLDKTRGLASRSAWVNDLLRRELRIMP